MSILNRMQKRQRRTIENLTNTQPSHAFNIIQTLLQKMRARQDSKNKIAWEKVLVNLLEKVFEKLPALRQAQKSPKALKNSPSKYPTENKIENTAASILPVYRDRNGNTRLHKWAIRVGKKANASKNVSNEGLSMTRLCFQKNNPATLIKNDNGLTPADIIKKAKIWPCDQTYFHLAIINYCLATLECLLIICPEAINTPNFYGKIPLQTAITSGGAASVALLLKQPQVNRLVCDKNNKTLLALAAEPSTVDLFDKVSLLLAQTDLAEHWRKPDRFGYNPLYIAAMTPDLELLDVLLSHPTFANQLSPAIIQLLNRHDRRGSEIALKQAFEKNYFSVIQFLLDAKPYVKKIEHLMGMIETDNVKWVETTLKFLGASDTQRQKELVEKVFIENVNALHIAVFCRSLHVLQFFIHHLGVNVNCLTLNDPDTALCVAIDSTYPDQARNNRVEVVKFLLNAKASPQAGLSRTSRKRMIDDEKEAAGTLYSQQFDVIESLLKATIQNEHCRFFAKKTIKSRHLEQFESSLRLE